MTNVNEKLSLTLKKINYSIMQELHKLEKIWVLNKQLAPEIKSFIDEKVDLWWILSSVTIFWRELFRVKKDIDNNFRI